MPGAGVASARPTPCLAEGIQCQATLRAGITGENGPASKSCGQIACQLLCSSGMSAQKRHHMLTPCIHHHHRRIGVLVLRQRSHQPGDGANGANHQQIASTVPVR